MLFQLAHRRRGLARPAAARRAALSMAWGGRLAFETFGLGFITSFATGMRRRAKFGALVPIYGTLVTSAIALIIAVPVSIGIALFLTDIAPRWMRGADRAWRSSCSRRSRASSTACGACSCSRRSWPTHVEPWLDRHLGNMAAHRRRCSSGPPIGIGMLTAGIVLGDHGHPVHRLGRARRVQRRPAPRSRNRRSRSARPAGKS